MAGVDVLIITALRLEHDSARDVGLAGFADHPGIVSWVERDETTATPYLLGEYRTAGGGGFSVALARPTRMGGTSTGPAAAALAERLRPRCLAMSGVCAGNPADVALGDVVVAQFAYEYDEGKRTADSFQPDLFLYPMLDTWVRTAQDLSTEDLTSFGEASEDDARIWLLERLRAGDQPRRHPALTRYFPGRTWADGVRSLVADGLITRRGDRLLLTGAGRRFIERTLDEDVPGPERLPFMVFVGPMASGAVVVKDGVTWDDLKQRGVRTVAGLEMEAATIASAAHRLEIPAWVVAKGVMDHADPRKEDRYKRFAARASAEVLFKLLTAQVERTPAASEQAHQSLVDSVLVLGGVTRDGPGGDFERAELPHVCLQIGEAVARAGADLVVCSPFPDSADVHAVFGYVRSGRGRVVHFHHPNHPLVKQRLAELLGLLGPDLDVRIVTWDYPAPEDDDSWEQAWLLCQIQALERADAVIAVGGHPSRSANTLLHLAELKQKVVVPFAFLGGAAGRAFERRDWARMLPSFDASVLRSRAGVPEVMAIVDRLVIGNVRPTHGYAWPPGRVFISRAVSDVQFGTALQAVLTGAGCDAVLGDQEVRADRMVEAAIQDAIVGADLFVALWSKNYALSAYCSDELDLALRRHEAGQLQIWLFNLDGSAVVSVRARRLSRVTTPTPQALAALAKELLESVPAV
jgi:nucleoside phosphorylase